MGLGTIGKIALALYSIYSIGEGVNTYIMKHKGMDYSTIEQQYHDSTNFRDFVSTPGRWLGYSAHFGIHMVGEGIDYFKDDTPNHTGSIKPIDSIDAVIRG